MGLIYLFTTEPNAETKSMLKLEHYQTAIENLHDAVMISQCKGGNPLIFVNDSFTQLTGYIIEDIHEKPCEFLYRSHQLSEPDSIEIASMQKCMKDRSSMIVSVQAYKKDGTPFYAEVSLSQVKNARGRTTHYLSIIRNTTTHVNLEKQLFAENHKLHNKIRELELGNKYDLVTGLLNRSALKNEVKGLFSGAKRAQEYFTMFFIGIDNYEKLKHECDQKTIEKLSQRLGSLLQNSLKRASDIVLRYSESEFIVCFTGQDNEVSALFAKKMVEMVKTHEFINEKTDLLSVSIGLLSSIPDNDLDINQCILSADMAMHDARSGKYDDTGVSVHHPS